MPIVTCTAALRPANRIHPAFRRATRWHTRILDTNSVVAVATGAQFVFRTFTAVLAAIQNLAHRRGKGSVAVLSGIAIRISHAWGRRQTFIVTITARFTTNRHQPGRQNHAKPEIDPHESPLKQ